MVLAFPCWCDAADWSSLALNMMLSVLWIFLNQHWRVAARKVEVAVYQSCFCRKSDCLKGGGAVWPFHFSNVYLFAKTVSFFVSILLFKTNLILCCVFVFFFCSLSMLPFSSLILTSNKATCKIHLAITSKCIHPISKTQATLWKRATC